jgi:hypothetical protein
MTDEQVPGLISLGVQTSALTRSQRPRDELWCLRAFLLRTTRKSIGEALSRPADPPSDCCLIVGSQLQRPSRTHRKVGDDQPAMA